MIGALRILMVTPWPLYRMEVVDLIGKVAMSATVRHAAQVGDWQRDWTRVDQRN